MEPEDTPPMSGSNSICVSTVLLDGGILPMTEPVTELTLEAPGGLVKVRAECRNGKAERIFVQNLPSFAARLDVPLEVEGLGRLTVDTAYGGDSFVVVNAAAMGFSLEAHEAHDIARLGVRITNAANAAIRFEHPENPDWQHFSFCLFAGPVTRDATGLRAGAAVNRVQCQGGQVLHAAATKGNAPMLRVLLEFSADIYASKPDGTTALSAASLAGHAGCVGILLHAHARSSSGALLPEGEGEQHGEHSRGKPFQHVPRPFSRRACGGPSRRVLPSLR